MKEQWASQRGKLAHAGQHFDCYIHVEADLNSLAWLAGQLIGSAEILMANGSRVAVVCDASVVSRTKNWDV